MVYRINRPMLHASARRVFAKVVVASPVLRRSDGSRHKATTAVRTDVAQDVINTCRAECTLIGTESGGNGLLQCSQVGLSSSMISSFRDAERSGSSARRLRRVALQPGVRQVISRRKRLQNIDRYLEPATDLPLVPKVIISELPFQVFLFPRDDSDLHYQDQQRRQCERPPRV